MTTRGSYPLETLLRLREEIRRRREQGLAVSTRALELAQEEQRRSRARLDEHHGRLCRERRRVFMQEAPLAAERQAAGRFLARLEAEAARLAAEAERAAETCRQREDEREAARQALASAEAELKVVEKNREAWTDERRRQAQARAEAELDDIVAARVSKGRP